MHCKAILFDLDGVLVDSAPCVRQICAEWALARGLDPELVFRTGQGRRVQETVRAVAPHLDVDAETALLVGMEARTTAGLAPLPGARALLDSLPPNVWAVVTSGARPVATLRLRHVGLPIPQTLITADDVVRGKPDPEGYLAAAEALHRRPGECIVVEDSIAGIAAARAAQMRVVAIAEDGDSPAARSADAAISSLSQLSVRRDAEGLFLRFA